MVSTAVLFIFFTYSWARMLQNPFIHKLKERSRLQFVLWPWHLTLEDSWARLNKILLTYACLVLFFCFLCDVLLCFFLLNLRQAYCLRSLAGSSVKKRLDSPRATCTLLFIVFNSQTNVKHELNAISRGWLEHITSSLHLVKANYWCIQTEINSRRCL